jgi:hypothetical protein
MRLNPKEGPPADRRARERQKLKRAAGSVEPYCAATVVWPALAIALALQSASFV